MHFNRLKKLKSNKKIFVVLILLTVLFLSVIIIALVMNDNQNSDDKNKSKQKDYKPSYNYTLLNSDIKCRQLPPYPNAKTTQNYCSGDITVQDSNNEKKTITLTNSAYLYKNGGIVPLDTLNTLVAEKTKLEIKYDTDSKEVILVSYVK